MTIEDKAKYRKVIELKRLLNEHKGEKYELDCGHHVTLGHNFGNNIMIYNDAKDPRIICSLCAY